MDDDRRREIIEQAHENVARIDAKQRIWAAERAERDPTAPDASVRWAAMMPKPEPPKPKPQPRPQRNTEMDSDTADAWNSWWDGRFSTAIERRDDGLLAVLGEEVDLLISARLREEETKLRADFNVELAELRAQLYELRNERSAEVIDLPSWPMRDRDAA
jgi:hypothetical protein